MHYLTRHLEALKEFNHNDRHLRIGDTFFATQIDAEYLIQHRRARDMPAEALVSVMEPPAVEPVPEVPQAEPQVEPAAEETPVEPTESASEAPAESEAVEQRPTLRRTYVRRTAK